MDELLLGARLFLAVVFFAAAVGKLLDVPGSRAALVQFGLSERAARPGGVALPAAEFAIAAGLLVNAAARLAAVAAAILLGAFIVGMRRVLRRGVAPDCHCFGQLHSAPVSRAAIARNALLLVPAVLLVAAGAGDALTDLSSAEQALVAMSALAFCLGLSTFLLWQTRGVHAHQALEPLEVGSAAPDVALTDPGQNRVGLTDLL